MTVNMPRTVEHTETAPRLQVKIDQAVKDAAGDVERIKGDVATD